MTSLFGKRLIRGPKYLSLSPADLELVVVSDDAIGVVQSRTNHVFKAANQPENAILQSGQRERSSPFDLRRYSAMLRQSCDGTCDQAISS